MPTRPRQQNVIEQLAAHWLAAKNVVREMTATEKDLNKRISTIVEQDGFTDDRGHIWLELPTPVEGFDTKGKLTRYNALQRQRRVTVTMDEETAMAVCQRAGIEQRCSESYLQVTDPTRAIAALEAAGLLGKETGIEVITTLKEDAVREAYFDNIITEEEFRSIFVDKISYALLPASL